MVIPIYTTPGSESGGAQRPTYTYSNVPQEPQSAPPVQQPPQSQVQMTPPQVQQAPPQYWPQQSAPPVPQQQPQAGWPQQQNAWTGQAQPWSAPPQQPAPVVRPAPQQVMDYSRPPALVRPSMPPVNSGRTYRVQVGAYRDVNNAREAFDHLVRAGFNPAYERYGDVYRVVLAGIRAPDMTEVARLLGAAGFREVIIREE
jgi:cell division protein FtsN